MSFFDLAFILVSDQLYLRPPFRISEVVAHNNFDCTSHFFDPLLNAFTKTLEFESYQDMPHNTNSAGSLHMQFSPRGALRMSGIAVDPESHRQKTVA